MFSIFKSNKEISSQETKTVQSPSNVAGNENFIMRVEDVFTITGRGTVVTGSIEKGQVAINDEVMISRNGIRTIIIGIEAFRKSLKVAQAGDNVGLLLKNIKREDIKRDDILTK